MKQAILVTAYRDLQSLVRLVSCFDEDFDFYIHIDKKCMEEMPDISGVQVHTIRRYSVHWGSEKHLWAIMELFRMACLNGPYSYYHIITASDYPVRPIGEFKSFFSDQNDKVYVDFHQLPWGNWIGEGGLERIKYYWIGNQWFDFRTHKMTLTKKLLKIQRKMHFSRNMDAWPQWYGGLSYFSVPHDAAESIATLPWRKVRRRTRFTHIAEEVFLQTMLVNTFPPERLVNNPLRYTVWEGGASGPKVLTEDSFDSIVESGHYFARKFDPVVSAVLMERIDKHCGFHLQNNS